MDWISEYLDHEQSARRKRAVTSLARTIYPTPFGAHGEPDEDGYSYPMPGHPRTASDYADTAFRALERQGLA